MPIYEFSQVDVFSPRPLMGNPVAVVHAADALSDEHMAAFARWTNLSETTFLLAPSVPGADYRLRIFTPGGELPFAGHPTLGSAHAWLERGGAPQVAGRVVQECGIGLIELRRDPERVRQLAGGQAVSVSQTLAFRAPDLLRSGPVDEATLARVAGALRITPGEMRGCEWIDNGPHWIGVVLSSAERVLDLRPDPTAFEELEIGVIGAHPAGGPADYEVRAFAPGLSVTEDPVTGSLNAGFATWLTRAGVAPGSYTVRQGTALGRSGNVSVTTDAAGDIWVGGLSTTLIRGTLQL